jgi:hypothetical protein
MLESESERISSSTTAAPSKSHFKLIAVIAIVAVSVIVGAFLVSAFISAPPPAQGQDAWLFKGAYATYAGSMTLNSDDLGLDDMPMNLQFTVDFTVRLGVVDFNSTHALISTSYHMSMSSSFGDMDEETVENETSAWVPLSEMSFMTEFEDVNVTNSYESTVNIEGFGNRNCMVYEYAISDEGLTMTVYVDKAIEWPLKMTVSMTNTELPQGLEINIALVETNIPALK